MARKLIRFTGLAILATLLAFPIAAPAANLPAGVSAELPVAMTCPGQAPDGQMVKMVMGRAKIPVKYDMFLEPKDLEGNKTLIIILGGSGKGLGSAGVDLREEMKRAEALIAEATKRKMKLIGIHAGGEDRRGEVSTKLIDLVAPKMQYIIVREDGNKDGLFNKLAAQHKIPLTVVKQTPDMGDILKALFNQ
jgi:hypothetical protein